MASSVNLSGSISIIFYLVLFITSFYFFGDIIAENPMIFLMIGLVMLVLIFKKK